MRAKEIAAYLGVSTSLVWKWVAEGIIKDGTHFGKRVTVWRKSYVDNIPKILKKYYNCEEGDE